ncbi:30S ribosome-binding factor RbfA [Campylobacter canadensis]|uniref:30S ribosome-binding factor RbfA n=1 Tax=Campylobacter canadensis TaxID=449520 RepID=A0ABS7WS84_9BACT|nr:30S ribosome-binding factor RbfA [Campylobacter canadensis]MBZ7987192.1 30S ribosome-binding factor RbfA [Campylobacter canadensis]MBZ7994456.1 30S ribosome-binding factor RbfA [Campylobacter canadensis]MBZ7996457.1 30S ribosome-binding factor RbfA [Campylobacter canadensis]MBZ7998184.1 30S ribosome-binding factor RbfA [Campylobacter canadensis]MBZ7999829.1 30S ribosome-binding factor RbfA [Campylobacter canadensis]
MDKANIKRLRTQSLLKELVASALNNFDDELINSQIVLDAECKKGRYDAFIYLDKQDYNKDEQQNILSKLQRVSKVIEAQCLNALQMYRCPKLHFKFDDTYERVSRLETLFKQINKG